MAALTMFIGNLAALVQQDLKRTLAYSSIAHAGYLLMGLVALTADSAATQQALVVYLATYALMSLGANKARVEKIVAEKNLQTLAKLVEELF
jgi:NADH-quinone oxidoreductase subunit N